MSAPSKARGMAAGSAKVGGVAGCMMAAATPSQASTPAKAPPMRASGGASRWRSVPARCHSGEIRIRSLVSPTCMPSRWLMSVVFLDGEGSSWVHGAMAR